MTREEINERISELLSERLQMEDALRQSDYKVIKCAESQAAGEELPYDINALHAERQEKRDRINSIDREIEELEKLVPEEVEPIDMEDM